MSFKKVWKVSPKRLDGREYCRSLTFDRSGVGGLGNKGKTVEFVYRVPGEPLYKTLHLPFKRLSDARKFAKWIEKATKVNEKN